MPQYFTIPFFFISHFETILPALCLEVLLKSVLTCRRDFLALKRLLDHCCNYCNTDEDPPCLSSLTRSLHFPVIVSSGVLSIHLVLALLALTSLSKACQ